MAAVDARVARGYWVTGAEDGVETPRGGRWLGTGYCGES